MARQKGRLKVTTPPWRPDWRTEKVTPFYSLLELLGVIIPVLGDGVTALNTQTKAPPPAESSAGETDRD